MNTTVAENFTGNQFDKLTGNVFTDGNAYIREYFDCKEVAKGKYSYGDDIYEKLPICWTSP